MNGAELAVVLPGRFAALPEAEWPGAAPSSSVICQLPGGVVHACSSAPPPSTADTHMRLLSVQGLFPLLPSALAPSFIVVVVIAAAAGMQVSELRLDLKEVQTEWDVKLQALRQDKAAAQAQLRRALVSPLHNKLMLLPPAVSVHLFTT